MYQTCVDASLAISTVESSAEFEELKTDWEALFRRNKRAYQVCQSYEWVREWVQLYSGENSEIFVIVGRIAGRVVMIWPLIKQRVFGLTVLTWMGHPFLLYGDVLIDPEFNAKNILQKAWDYISSLGIDVVALNKVPGDAVIGPLIAELNAVPSVSYESPFLAFPPGSDLDSRYSGKAKARRRKQLRDLESEGPVTFEFCEEGKRLSELIHIALVKKREWARSSQLYAYYLSDPLFESFLNRLASAHNKDVRVRAAAISCGNDVLGIEIGLRCCDVMFGAIISIDESYKKRHVGELLANYVFRQAFDSGCVGYDLYFPSTPFKMRWADSVVAVHDWSFGLSIRGRTWLWARPHLFEIFLRLPIWLRRQIGLSLGSV